MLDVLLERFFVYLKVTRNYPKNTLLAYRADLKEFRNFLENQKITAPAQIDKIVVRKYILELNLRKLSRNSIIRKLSTLKSFLKHLVRNGVIESKILVHLNSPRKESKLPVFLSEKEIKEILDSPVKENFKTLRMRAILETLYSTGIRIGELVSTNLSDLDILSGVIKVLGKGSKERIIPLGESACEALKNYLSIRRNKSPASQAVFINQRGGRLTSRGVSGLLKNWLKEISFSKKISPHTFRHTFATHLLDRGCDLKSIQEMLGHSSLSTTQIYTHFTVDRLKKIYQKAHPRKDGR